MLLANEIDPSMSPACVYKLSPEFQKYTLQVFRGALAQARKKSGEECKIF